MLIAFIPVLHAGYLELFRAHEKGVLGILGADVIALFSSLTRDCRTIAPENMRAIIERMGIFREVRVLSLEDLATLAAQDTAVTMPQEDVAHALVAKFAFSRVTFSSIFLRWDKMPTQKENVVAPHRIITREAFARDVMRRAREEAQLSADWWRQVGALFVREGSVVMQAHNHHLPSDFHLAYRGDPRTNFNAGERIDISTAVHAEASAIAACAKQGVALAGADAFVTTFPCPNCARLLAEAGIVNVYYQQGYSLLDAEEILTSFGITITLVQD